MEITSHRKYFELYLIFNRLKMPKRYYCEFCQKSFQDTVKSRKNHLKGFSHQRNRKAYYDSALGMEFPSKIYTH